MNSLQYGFFNELEKLGYYVEGMDFNSPNPYAFNQGTPTAAPAPTQPMQPVQQPVQQPMQGGINASAHNRNRVALRRSVRHFGQSALGAAGDAAKTGIVYGVGANMAGSNGVTAGLGSAGLGFAKSMLGPGGRLIRDASTVARGGLAEGGKAVGARFQRGMQGARAGMAGGSNMLSRGLGAVSGFGRGLFKRAALRRHLMRKLAAMETAGDAMSSIKKRLYNPIKAIGFGAHVTNKHLKRLRSANPGISDKGSRNLAYRSSSEYIDKLRKRFPL